uniref:SPRY domain-containing protein 7 n=1 Tax=Lepeophtheirus salmonis TaxID=72036 RepID=A0A0K2V5X2_LEPSM
MSFIGSCFSSIVDCFNGGDWNISSVAKQNNSSNHLPSGYQPIPDVILDTTTMGQEAVVVKNGSRLCGTGSVRSSTPISQSKAYWEVQVQQSGQWSCGLCTPSCDLNKSLGNDQHSWVIDWESNIKSRNEVEYTLEQPVQEGDIIGFTYDHVELNFYLNGNNLNCPILGIKGTVFPVLYVDDGAILDVIFEKFRYPIPSGFDRIMVEKVLL